MNVELNPVLSIGYRGALSAGVKRPGRGPDHLNPSTAEVDNAWN